MNQTRPGLETSYVGSARAFLYAVDLAPVRDALRGKSCKASLIGSTTMIEDTRIGLQMIANRGAFMISGWASCWDSEGSNALAK